MAGGCTPITCARARRSTGSDRAWRGARKFSPSAGERLPLERRGLRACDVADGVPSSAKRTLVFAGVRTEEVDELRRRERFARATLQHIQTYNIHVLVNVSKLRDVTLLTQTHMSALGSDMLLKGRWK